MTHPELASLARRIAAGHTGRDLAEQLAAAARAAGTTRERQLAALAAARLDGDRDRLVALGRDHLNDHPDDALAVLLLKELP